MVSHSLLRDFDGVARAIGESPKLDRAGNPIPIGLPEDKDAIYVVWVGRCIGLFYNWGLAQAMTCGFSGCAFKKYLSLKDALLGWFQGPIRAQGTWKVPKPRPPIYTIGPPPDPTTSPAKNDPPAPEVDVAPQTPPSIPVDLPPESPNFEEEYWGSDEDADEFHDPEEPPSTPSPPASPTLVPARGVSLRDYIESQKTAPPASPSIATASSFPLSSMLTDGTISPNTIHTPLLASPVSLGSPLSSLHSFSPKPVLHGSSPLRGGASTAPASADPFGHGGHADPGASSLGAPPRRVRIVYVVVRGEKPGIYFDKNLALQMVGTKPGIKIVKFPSLSRAGWYFGLEYMAGRVGRPVLAGDGKPVLADDGRPVLTDAAEGTEV
ncbi:uncharacterized protein TRAVEDRAFT_52754 [Trametes versicolor FP-101664 SS1]|uniref:uncharacterized protein n=1 Tax=Trametes versicolor (strain FP-101664) TaxID=717944 RepID=UPI0004623191|nr:uncharacterized protein TRAVEDRAFT_52754 [Trametes versicolor FP-101664 SS1]EIW53634.1 hypothetical protein TRAVEDRAFT_52754 [Trametes versicolor FP-101664 SS1]